MSLLNHIRLRKGAYCTMFLPLLFLSIFLVEKSLREEKIPKVIVKLSASKLQDKEERSSPSTLKIHLIGIPTGRTLEMQGYP